MAQLTPKKSVDIQDRETAGLFFDAIHRTIAFATYRPETTTAYGVNVNSAISTAIDRLAGFYKQYARQNLGYNPSEFIDKLSSIHGREYPYNADELVSCKLYIQELMMIPIRNLTDIELKDIRSSYVLAREIRAVLTA